MTSNVNVFNLHRSDKGSIMNEKTVIFTSFLHHKQDLLKNLFGTESFSDVTLVSDDEKIFKAHKIVFSACSTVFKNIIDSLPLNCSVQKWNQRNK